MKTCLICAATKPLGAFAIHAQGRGGLHPWCKECVSAYNSERYRNGKMPRRYTRKSAVTLLPYTPPPKKTDLAAAEPGYKTADRAWRRALKLRAVPPWVDFRATVGIYAAADACGYDVDHIVPLKGRRVCGLHVPWNLQLLTPSENARKNNRYHDPW